MATLINFRGDSSDVRVTKGWQEIHVPRPGRGVPRFYTKPTDYRSDQNYIVYAKDREREGDVFREAEGFEGADYSEPIEIDHPSITTRLQVTKLILTYDLGVSAASAQVLENTDSGPKIIYEEISKSHIKTQEKIVEIAGIPPEMVSGKSTSGVEELNKVALNKERPQLKLF